MPAELQYELYQMHDVLEKGKETQGRIVHPTEV